MLGCVLAFALSSLPDGGMRYGYAPVESSMRLQDGGIVIEQGGCWLSADACVARAQERIELRLRVEKAEAKQVASPPADLALAFGVGAATGVTLGAIVTLVIVALATPAQPPM